MLQNLHKASVANNLNLFANAEQASIYVAHQIAELIWQHQKQGKPTILGLATGNTPKRVYQELIRLHHNESLSFANVISFNLDEYYPIYPENQQSYTYFMRQYLFDHKILSLKTSTYLMLIGIAEYCKDYENKIANSGGLDLQLLGIGRNGIKVLTNPVLALILRLV